MAQYEPTDISPHQTELATKLRVPMITTPYPHWYYVTAIVVPTDPDLGLVPTEDEVRMVASFNDEHRAHQANEARAEHLAAFAPYDIDPATTGRYLIKHASGGWGYRMDSWRFGPTWVPDRNDDPEPLEALLDRFHNLSPRWVAWKEAHPEMFSPVTTWLPWRPTPPIPGARL